MATSLIKEAFLPLDTTVPMPVLTDNLLHHVILKCPFCGQRYMFGYSSGEEFRLNGWTAVAKDAIGRSHGDGHDLMDLPLPGMPPPSLT